MKTSLLLILGSLCLSGARAGADPLLSSWYTNHSTIYARIYASSAAESSGTPSTTWTGQTLPTYAGVHEIDYSPSWVYIKNSGLPGQVMGPWSNPNLPANQGSSTPVYRFPRTASVPTTKTLTSMGAIGFFVDGMAIYNTSDGYSYSHSHAEDATPNGTIGNGDGIWNRDAWVLEFSSFDSSFAHNPPGGQYHAHADPIATRYFVGDNVNYNSATNVYSENTSTTTFKHSPILGWLSDGLPLYGPYGYDGGGTGAAGYATINGGGGVASVVVTSAGTMFQTAPMVTFSGGGGSGAAATATISGTGGGVTSVTITSAGTGYTSAPTVAIGGVRRMISGYVLRTGSYGTTNLASTGRTTLPAWALAAQGRSSITSSQYGPATTYSSGSGVNLITYGLGHYAEDYDYLGDHGYVQGALYSGTVLYDLNKYNARYCATPDYPNGTWAYFVTLKTDGTSPAYPYNTGRWYMGTPSGGATTVAVMDADTPLTQYFKGALGTTETWASSAPVSVSGSTVTLTWHAVQGAIYTVTASDDLSTATNLSPTVTATGCKATTTDTGAAATNPARFYIINRTGTSSYDSNGY